MLKKLELTGFKSFAKKTSLDFSQPVTGIVGPNGSGKSNVVEAFRYVLGEQSIKSLRGKSGSDLIFKGSKQIPKQSRANVSITFDNKKKLFKLHNDSKDSINLDFDEVTISREVFSDGTNTYKVNGSEVRLKDVVEILGSVHIGSSGHHIISQGAADRVLNANPKERREMVEDALGLKVYQYRIKDATRKLEKTELNMKEIESLRRELAPHIKFLKKQVEKVEKTRELQDELKALYHEYLKKEELYLHTKGAELKQKKDHYTQELSSIENSLSVLGEPENRPDTQKRFREEIRIVEQKQNELARVRDELVRKLGRIEGMLEMSGSRPEEVSSTGTRSIAIPEIELKSLLKEFNTYIDSAVSKKAIADIVPILARMKSYVESFVFRFSSQVKDPVIPGNTASKVQELKATKNSIAQELKGIEDEEHKQISLLTQYKEALRSSELKESGQERERFSLEMKKRDIASHIDILRLEEETFTRDTLSFEEELREGRILIGPSIREFEQYQVASDGSVESRVHQEERRKKIERIKIRLEDAGGVGADDILKEYNETTQRDEFLSKELSDLKESVHSTTVLIETLRTELDQTFKEGIEKINQQFQEFFKLMFGGGEAFLSLVADRPKKIKKVSLEEMSEEEILESKLDDGEEKRIEYGIDVNVSLPRKKVRDLGMLSGGERSLTSIALLFSISQVNPPPFIVLDETDAALDEANSRRYGDMVENLGSQSQLIVVTHNRETMSRANVLYGVTIGADGGSKLLSIKFDDAEQWAK